MTEFERVYCTILKETEKAILISTLVEDSDGKINDANVWIPLSQTHTIYYNTELPKRSFVEISSWFVRKKGIVQ